MHTVLQKFPAHVDEALCRLLHDVIMRESTKCSSPEVVEKEAAKAATAFAAGVRAFAGIEVIPPVSPMSILETKALDGRSRWHLQVSVPPSQSLRFELPRNFDPRLVQEPTGKFALIFDPRDSRTPPSPEK